MNVPGHTEEEVLQAINEVVSRLRNRFRLPGMDRSDIEQMMRLQALECLAKGKYDPSRPLIGYIFTHCNRRMLNEIRDRVGRHFDPPCLVCHVDGGCGENGEKCEKYKRFVQRNNDKANIAAPVGIEQVAPEVGLQAKGKAGASVECKELRALIDAHLPLDLRSDYLRLLDGMYVPSRRTKVVRDAVRDILEASEVF